MTDPESGALHRRRFLKGVVIAGGATIAAPAAVQAQAPRKAEGQYITAHRPPQKPASANIRRKSSG
ncbi:MAG: hypothetical protein WDN50_25450 [Bradyrhizobium sp.]